jgi:hypothetical protein
VRAAEPQAGRRLGLVRVIVNTERLRARWSVWLVSIAWPLVLPIANSIRLRRIVAALSGLPLEHQKQLIAFEDRSLLTSMMVAVALSVLTCSVIIRRSARAEEELAGRVLVDALLLTAFVCAPWLQVSILRGRPSSEFASLWVGPGLLTRMIPPVCAVLAGLSVAWAISRLKGAHVREAA